MSTGAFVSKLLTTRINYNFNTKTFINALVQYNSDNRQWTSNLRFNVIHRPLSDFFFVFNERRDERTGQMLTRAIIAKMTYLDRYTARYANFVPVVWPGRPRAV